MHTLLLGPHRSAADGTAVWVSGDPQRSAPGLVAAPPGRRGPGAQPALDAPAQRLLPAGLWADQIPAAADRLRNRQGEEHQLPGDLHWVTALWLALAGTAGSGGGGFHGELEKKRPPSTPLSHGVKATAQVLALALTLWRRQPTASGGCWPRGGPSGRCSPALWTTANPVLPYRCAPPQPA